MNWLEKLTILGIAYYNVNTHLGRNCNQHPTFIKLDPMARNTSILLGEHFEDFISAKISSGKYNSASEVIRTALRLFEAEELKTKPLSKALIQGEKSRLDMNFDPKAHLKKLHRKAISSHFNTSLAKKQFLI